MCIRDSKAILPNTFVKMSKLIKKSLKRSVSLENLSYIKLYATLQSGVFFSQELFSASHERIQFENIWGFYTIQRTWGCLFDTVFVKTR